MTQNAKKRLETISDVLIYLILILLVTIFFVSLFFSLIYLIGHTMAKSARAESLNLIQNNSLEIVNSIGLPSSWGKGGYGTNTRTLTYPVTGYNGGNAIKVEISSYVSGDAKWYFSDILVSPGDTYVFSDYYHSNVQSVIDVRYIMTDGTYKYIDLGLFEATSSLSKSNIKFTVPDNVTSLTFFHLISSVGYLVTDEYSLVKVTPIPPPVIDPKNLISNANFEQADSNGLPLDWKKGGYGANTRNLAYPTDSYDGTKAVTVNVTQYASGDAKWFFTPISLPAGTYSYSDYYSSNLVSLITVQYQNTDGRYSYKDIAVLPPAATFEKTSIDFQVPVGTLNITVFHLIEGVGYLTIDNASLFTKQILKGIFTTGAVTFRFDDGWVSQYTNAIPKLDSVGLKGTFFIASRQLLDYGFAGYLNKLQLKEMYNSGHEIGAHTKTHPHLINLAYTEQLDEIQGSKDDLISMGLGSINSFSYPFGEYNPSIIQIVKDVGFQSAVSVINGFVSPESDKYQIERKHVIVTTTFDEIKAMIDQAVLNKKWLIFELHEINNSGRMYSITKETFDQVVDYVVQKQIPVVTISEGILSM